MNPVLCKELDELSAAIDRVLSERDRYKADADRLALTNRCLIDAIDDHIAVRPMAKRLMSLDSAIRKSKAALAAHERGEG